MPSRPVSSLANGFLALLGVKNMGQNPDILLDEIRPGMDMFQWYAESNAQNAQGGFAQVTPVSNQLNIFTVPPGELWFVHSLSCFVQLSVFPNATEIRAFGSIVSVPHPFASYVGDKIDYVAAVPTVLQSGAVLHAPSLRNVWAPPGSVLGISAFTISAVDNLGAESYFAGAQVRYTPIRV